VLGPHLAEHPGRKRSRDQQVRLLHALNLARRAAKWHQPNGRLRINRGADDAVIDRS
jgi:hypothetical protein